MDGSGNAIAVWHQYDGSPNSIYNNRYDASSGSWSTAELISTGNAFNPQVAVDGSGNVIAVWKQYDGSYYSTWSNRFE